MGRRPRALESPLTLGIDNVLSSWFRSRIDPVTGVLAAVDRIAVARAVADHVNPPPGPPPTLEFQVDHDGRTVWTGSGVGASTVAFPEQYLGRPLSGTVRLYIGGELVAVQTATPIPTQPLDPEASPPEDGVIR